MDSFTFASIKLVEEQQASTMRTTIVRTAVCTCIVIDIPSTVYFTCLIYCLSRVHGRFGIAPDERNATPTLLRRHLAFSATPERT